MMTMAKSTIPPPRRSERQMTARDPIVVDAVLAGAWRRDSGLHGEVHWRCVAATGLDLLRDVPGADPDLVFLFGLLHDTRRENDHRDPDHGPRASAYARELHGEGLLPVTAAQLELLCHAIDLHTNGLVSDDATVAICWDSDRLHLPRVGIQPDPARFSTDAAQGRTPLEQAAAHRERAPGWTELVDAYGTL